MDLLTINSLYPLKYTDGTVLLYAPLADSVLQVTETDLHRIEEALEKGEACHDEEAASIVKDLTDVMPPSSRPGYVMNVRDFNNFTILPTNRCNFSCSFCYSQAGRGKETLDIKTVKRAISWFVKTCRKDGRTLHITIYGGGEPMLAWTDVVRPTLAYIEDIKQDYNVEIKTTLITNGSVIPDDAVETLKLSDVDVAVSFEVIESLQNIHRKNYRLVSENIRRLTEGGILPRINAVITPDSVNRQVEIIERLHYDFPSADYISLEPENTVGLPASFYDDFTDSFLLARNRAEEFGIEATCSALRNCDVTVDRYCAGELCLTPSGMLTLCPCISAESQPGFDDWIYGRAGLDGVEVDSDRLSELLSLNLSAMPHCDKCFARYNCGGGCLHNYFQNGRKHDEGFCIFTRNFLKRIIRQRYDRSNIE